MARTFSTRPHDLLLLSAAGAWRSTERAYLGGTNAGWLCRFSHHAYFTRRAIDSRLQIGRDIRIST